MHQDGRIERMTEAEMEHQKKLLIALTEGQAAILEQLPQEERAELYPIMKTYEEQEYRSLGFKLKPGEIPIK